MIRGDVIGARAKSSKGLGMAGKGWDSLTWDCFNICFAFLCHHPFLLLEKRDLLALVACSLSYSSHWSGKDCEEEEEEELCLPSRGGSNYL